MQLLCLCAQCLHAVMEAGACLKDGAKDSVNLVLCVILKIKFLSGSNKLFRLGVAETPLNRD